MLCCKFIVNKVTFKKAKFTPPNRRLDLDKFREDVRINLVTNTDNNFDEGDNYKGLVKSISDAQRKQIDSKRFKYNKYKHKKSKWITFGLLKSIEFRDNLYRELKKTPGVPSIAKITRIQRLIYAHITGLLTVVKHT